MPVPGTGSCGAERQRQPLFVPAERLLSLFSIGDVAAHVEDGPALYGNGLDVHEQIAARAVLGLNLVFDVADFGALLQLSWLDQIPAEQP